MTDLARRRWLKGLLPAAGDAVVKAAMRPLDRAFPPQRRPPGAVLEASFLALCTRCGDCGSACPHAAIHSYAEGAGVLAGTPVLVPEDRACHMCDGFPCTSACETGALVEFEETTWSLGEARLVADRCIAFSGPDCGACGSLCPDDAPALRLTRGRPDIDGQTCVGCGRCVEACPVLPAAIEMVPLRE